MSYFVHPLDRPTFFLREALPRDVPFLMAIGESHGPTVVNWRSEQIAQDIERSRQSFRGQVPNPSEQTFIFVTVERFRHKGSEGFLPVGYSHLSAKYGTPEHPRHAYEHVQSHTRDRAKPEGYRDNSRLILVQDMDGPARLGSIVVHRQLQRNLLELSSLGQSILLTIGEDNYSVIPAAGYGTAVSAVRLFWTGFPHLREHFADRRCFAELLPSFFSHGDVHRTNAFFERFRTANFDGMPYDIIDCVLTSNPALLDEQLPSTVRVSELPQEARDLLGKIGSHSLPAAKLLARWGFRQTNRMNPLHGGPHFEAKFSDLPLWVGVQQASFQGTPNEAKFSSLWQYGLVGVYETTAEVTFRACLGPYHLEGSIVTFPQNIREFLRCKKNQPVCVVPLPA